MSKIRKENKGAWHFSVFQKRKTTSEMPFRIGFELHNSKVSVNLNIPFLLRLAYYSPISGIKDAKNSYGIEHIYDFRLRNFFRTGVDTYKGEFAILLPVVKLWLKCDYLSNEFRQFGRFTILVFLLKIKWSEITFRAGIAGFRVSFRLAFDELFKRV